MSTDGRLTPDDVRDVPQRLPAYDADLVRRTGLSLRQIAARAAGLDDDSGAAAMRALTAAVVRITSGQGVIHGFAEAVRAILAHLGAETFVALGCDVAGLAEAVAKRADVVFLADDDRFIALSPFRGRVVDNAEATARGYVAALSALAGGLSQRPVLVIGAAGRVGWHAVQVLEERGARVSVFDSNQDHAKRLAVGREIAVEPDLEPALRRHTLIVDATPAAGIIKARHIASDTMIAAPGMPLGLTDAARRAVGDRLIHDALELGAAAMLALAASAHAVQTRTGG